MTSVALSTTSVALEAETAQLRADVERLQATVAMLATVAELAPHIAADRAHDLEVAMLAEQRLLRRVVDFLVAKGASRELVDALMSDEFGGAR